MSEQHDGGPAFPVKQPLSSDALGMTLRDYFAAKAMQSGLATNTEYPDENWRYGLALDAYKMADAMLAARNNK